ncbi:MAG TPA: ABC transporter substrate-binding protein [Anaerolineales bacterium]|nr:ABC transporter substrate-binding protein [Anaerolineales bacterium]
MNVRKICCLIVVCLAFLTLSACAQTPVIETVTVREVVTQMVAGTPQTKIVEVVVTPTPVITQAPEKASPFNRSEAIRLGVLADLDGLNPFYLFDITGSSYWNYVYTSAYYPLMFTFSDQRWDWVPQIAEAPPGPITKEGDFYVGTVSVKDGMKWSDGTPLTAEDVAFTANTVLTFALSGNWAGYYNPTVLDHVEAVDALTLKYYYLVQPGLPVWQYGALLAPTISKAYWEPKVADVLARAEALDPQAADYFDQVTPLQQELEAISAEGEPTWGGIKFGRWEPGAYVEDVYNDQFNMIGTVEEEYANGAYREQNEALGYDFTLYGTASQTKTLELTFGPYFDSFLFPIYSQDAAYLALQSGEVDIVLNPSGVPKGVREQLAQDPNINLVRNDQNGFRYIEFNQARPYFSGEQGTALRQAIACMVDSKFLATSVLQNEVSPVYTLVPQGLTNWYNPNVPIYCQDYSEGQRLTEAVRILKEAGFTWVTEPSYIEGSARDAGYVYGDGIILPDGTPLPELDFQAPGPGYDPLRATIAVHIEQWLKTLGIPVTMNYTPFNTIRANENSGDFDIIMLGWGLTPFPSYLCDFFTGATGVGDGSDNISYVSPKLHEQCTAFYSEPDMEKAKQLVYDIQVTLATELPYIMLFTNPIFDAYSKTINYPYTTVFDGLQGLYSGWYLVMPTSQN